MARPTRPEQAPPLQVVEQKRREWAEEWQAEQPVQEEPRPWEAHTPSLPPIDAAEVDSISVIFKEHTSIGADGLHPGDAEGTVEAR